MNAIAKYQFAIAITALCIVSTILNALYGYSRGSTVPNAWALCCVYVALDLLKSSIPATLHTISTRLPRYLLIFAMVFCSAWSFAASIGFYLNTRGSQTQQASNTVQAIHNTTAEIIELKARRKTLGTLRPLANLNLEITQRLAKKIRHRRKWQTIAAATDHCSKSVRNTYTVCRTVRDLQLQVSKARDYKAITSKIDTLESRLARLQSLDTQTDVFTQTITTTFALPSRTWNLTLAVLLALTLELATCLGPSYAFRRSLWSTKQHDEQPTLDGDPAIFVSRHTRKTKGARTTAKALYDCYLTFCATQGLRPLTKTAFGLWMRRAGYDRIKSSGMNVYVDLT